MKRRFSALLLALGLSVSVLSMGVYAAETETEAVTEAVTEAAEVAEAESEAAEAAEEETAAAEIEVAETPETKSQEELAADALTSVLSEVSAWDDATVEEYMLSDDASMARIAANWSAVRGELGSFVEVLDAELKPENTAIVVTGHASYDNAEESTEIVITYTADRTTGYINLEWEMIETMGTKMKKAALNTLMGVGIVFLALLFLSILIGKLHYIPDMIEARAKKNAPAPAPAPAPVAAPAPVVEEDLTDDLELVAVITAAIAASENTSSDGFVVRSIKKANKRNWQRA